VNGVDMEFRRKKLKCSRCLHIFDYEEDILISHFDWEFICKNCQEIEKSHIFHEDASKTSLNSAHKSELFGLPGDWDEFFNKKTFLKSSTTSSPASAKDEEIKRKLPKNHPFYEISDVAE
jgi:hypothetical protein